MKMIFCSFWLLLDHQNIPLGQHLATSPKACAVIRPLDGAPRIAASMVATNGASKATVGEHR
jgi:hypothetical protein